MIYFSNPGTFDIRLLSSFGVSAKPNSTSPIGKFGTGLKNAIAGVLRLGGTVSIHTGDTELTIFSKDEDFRGTTHSMVWMIDTEGQQVPLHFSTSLGAHWEPWMIYREFYCNAKDEGGGKPSLSYPSGGVVFCVACQEVEAILAQHSSFFLEGKPIETLPSLEVHAGQSPHVYFKGVKVYTAEHPFLFTYNFTYGLSLTEDRTVAAWDVRYHLTSAFLSSKDSTKPILRSILLAEDTHMEHILDFSSSYNYPSETFKSEVSTLASTHRSQLPKAHISWVKTHSPGIIEVQTTPFTPAQKSMLEECYGLLSSSLGIHWNYPTFLSPEVSSSQLGMVVVGKVYLNPNTFKHIHELFSTLLEEHIHIATSHSDFTREFQEDLHKIIRQLVFQTPSPAELASHPKLTSDEIPF